MEESEEKEGIWLDLCMMWTRHIDSYVFAVGNDANRYRGAREDYIGLESKP